MGRDKVTTPIPRVGGNRVVLPGTGGWWFLFLVVIVVVVLVVCRPCRHTFQRNGSQIVPCRRGCRGCSRGMKVMDMSKAGPCSVGDRISFLVVVREREE